MNRYEPSIPRAACAFASVAMAALVIGVTIVLPAINNPGVERILVVGTPITDEPMVQTSATPSPESDCKPSPAAASV